MPQRVICYRCRYVLYDEEQFTPLNEIICCHTGTCPNCGRTLSLQPLDVEVTPINK